MLALVEYFGALSCITRPYSTQDNITVCLMLLYMAVRYRIWRMDSFFCPANLLMCSNSVNSSPCPYGHRELGNQPLSLELEKDHSGSCCRRCSPFLFHYST